MTEKSKDYLLKTLVAFALMAIGAWGIKTGVKLNVILGTICFVTGFAICAVLYSNKWLWWW